MNAAYIENAPYCVYFSSPIGVWEIVCSENALLRLEHARDRQRTVCESTLTTLVQEQLQAYFDGKLRRFDLPLETHGTTFQKTVWAALCEIEYGRTCSYADIALRIGKPKAYRAVGMANHMNPISIVIPCHRVIGKSGDLVGYGGGLDIKAALLRLEKQYSDK